MSNEDELNIIMLAIRGTGKTSLLAAMHEEFDKTFERANLQAWTEDSNTLRAIEECKAIFSKIDARLKDQVTPTEIKENPWNDQGFFFEIGSEGKKFIKLRFTDPSGEYFKSAATPTQKEYVREKLNQCDAVVIPIDATALMQNKRGKVSHGEIGIWHEEKNNPQRITQLLKDAYTNVKLPRLVILAPIKCETYMQNSTSAEDLLDHIKMGYQELLNFLSDTTRKDKISVVITPVQTIGNVVYAYHKTDGNGLTTFYYNKTPINAPYKPKDGDQPLRYILLFLINVYLERKQQVLKDYEAKFRQKTAQVNFTQEKLEEAKKELDYRKEVFNTRNQTWWLVREILNSFDDVETPYYQAEGEVNIKNNELQEKQQETYIISNQIEATQEEIKIFNKALFKFAIGAKNNDGFAIIQGHKFVDIPDVSIF